MGDVLLVHIETISPIFIIITLGYLIKKAGFFEERALEQINKFIFNFSLPMLVFLGISRSELEILKFKSLLFILFPTMAALTTAFVVGLFLGLKAGKLGTFIQTSIHGNVSYVGLAVLFYTLGEEGLRSGSLFVGFLIILNNTVSILTLHFTSNKRNSGFVKPLVSIFTTPVIVATCAAVFFSWTGTRLPAFIERSVNILSNIALPMALIVIGATVKWELLSSNIIPATLASAFKIFVLPLMAIPFLKYLGMPQKETQALIILLASPCAISSYIMAKELEGDSKLASGAITLSTVFSPVGFIAWSLIF